MKGTFLIAGFVLCTAAPLRPADSSDVIRSEWWIASRRDPGILRNSIGEARSFRITGENGEFYNLELPNAATAS
jgi:hypothetical protein